MKRYWSGLVVAGVMAATATLGAQRQSPVNSPPPDVASPPGSQRAPAAPSAQTRTPDNITVTGCIRNAPANVAAGQAASPRTPQANQPSTAGQRQGSTRFVLANATMTASGDASRSVVGTTGTASTTYQLDGDAALISPHVNHRVEISGALQSPPASPAGSPSATAGSTAPGTMLKVESVKMLADTCTSPTGTQQQR